MSRGLMTGLIFDKIFNELKKNLESFKVIVFYHGGEPLIKIYIL